ncbi:hypothetical protein LSH36_1549g00018 [Paralvinella palmiformis]|uniref:Autophagy-related protein 16 domain-containing protein n=1 Tax=Paralvinella palmiformis TaxID=53620 RepID=A0AAD9ISM9_9ANNE|nr:hypothetical protein LSH36_1549g00018 [Paralvinella palmiformis]
MPCALVSQDFSDVYILFTDNKLYESIAAYKSQNVHLTVEVEKLKEENLELRIKAEAGSGGSSGGGSGTTGEKTHALEQKVLKLMDELTELHRNKGENAQQVIDLKNTLQEKEKELLTKSNRISELESLLESARAANVELEKNVAELETTNQLLTDEQQALQLAYIGLEEKFRKMQEDNNELVSRWMEWKAKIADQLNEENEKFRHAKQQKVLKDLEDAVKDTVKIEERGADFVTPVLNFCVTVPTRALQKLEAHEAEVNCIKWSPSGKRFATGGSDRKLKLWEVSQGKCESRGILIGSNAAVMSVEFDYGETLILAASNDFASRVWTVSDQRLRHTLTGHSGKVLAAKFLGEPQKVVSGSHDRTLKIWDLRNKACIKTIFTGSKCNDLVVVDMNNLISGHFDKKVRFIDTRCDGNFKEISFPDRVASLDLSCDRNTLLSCCRDDSVVLVDLRMNQVSSTLSADGFHVGSDWTRAVFSPDGEYIVAGSSDGSLFIWNVAKNSVEKVLKEHNHGVMACSWSPMGSSILSCDKHKTVILWSDF